MSKCARRVVTTSCASEHVRSTRWRRSTAKRGLRAGYGAASLFIWAKLLCLLDAVVGEQCGANLSMSVSLSLASRKSRIMDNENSTSRNVSTFGLLQLGRSLTLSTRTIPIFIGKPRDSWTINHLDGIKRMSFSPLLSFSLSFQFEALSRFYIRVM